MGCLFALLTILKEISPGCSLEGLMLKLKLQYFGPSCKELTHWKRPWCWEGLGAGGEGDDRGWDGWMASPVDDRQGGLACCSSWGCKESDTTEQMNWTELSVYFIECHSYTWWQTKAFKTVSIQSKSYIINVSFFFSFHSGKKTPSSIACSPIKNRGHLSHTAQSRDTVTLSSAFLLSS